MKTFFSFILLSTMGNIAVMGQTTFELAAIGSYKSTWLLNKNISDAGASQDYAPGWGYNFGIAGTVMFTDKIGLELNVLYAQHTGAYTGSYGVSNLTYDSHVTLQQLDFPLLLVVQTGPTYFEIGPQYSSISKATYTANWGTGVGGVGVAAGTSSSGDVSSYYSHGNISAVLGFGGNITLTDHLFIKTGLRFEYGLSDLKGVDATKGLLSNSIVYPNPAKTHSAAGGLLLGIVYLF